MKNLNFLINFLIKVIDSNSKTTRKSQKFVRTRLLIYLKVNLERELKNKRNRNKSSFR